MTQGRYPTMTRFFAHLCLFFQMIDIPVSPFATQIILESYLQVLEVRPAFPALFPTPDSSSCQNAGQRELIAMYAGALGDNAVERYAMFLTSLELAGDAQERRLALARARDHGLDIERVAIVTAERTIEKTFAVSPPPLSLVLRRLGLTLDGAGADPPPGAGRAAGAAAG